MEKSFSQYLQENSIIGMWIKTPRWIALCLPIIDILYRQFGGMIGILFAVFNLTPIGLLYNAWGGIVVLFEGGSFIEGLTGQIKSSNPLINIISFDLILIALFFYFYKKNLSKTHVNKKA